jgi:hypothetical protein
MKGYEELASTLLQVGEYPMTGDVSEMELAAMMLVVQTIYNMEEAVTKS